MDYFKKLTLFGAIALFRQVSWLRHSLHLLMLASYLTAAQPAAFRRCAALLSLAVLLFAASFLTLAASGPVYPLVQEGVPLEFPRDHGAHPAYRTEWWYITGRVRSDTGQVLGIQLTFFRSRPDLPQGNPSRFAPDQLLFAHAAISDPASGRLLHEQRSAREGFGLAQASTETTAVQLGDWSLVRAPDGSYHGQIQAAEFGLDLQFRPSGPPLLQGKSGYSRKGPDPAQASYYYSQPQLAVRGQIDHQGKRLAVQGTAWLDHEWASAVLASEAVGWDWTGINLDDGAAFMAFRIRDKNDRVYWTTAMWRDADGRSHAFRPEEIEFTALRFWQSPHTGARYPVAWRLRLGSRQIELQPLMDDQELDSRASTGTVYWEGAVDALDENEQPIGQGYLELTGYFQEMDL